MIYRQKGYINFAIEWKDKRDVLLLSTKHWSGVTAVKVEDEDGKKLNLTPIVDYNLTE